LEKPEKPENLKKLEKLEKSSVISNSKLQTQIKNPKGSKIKFN